MATTITTLEKPIRARALDTSGNNNHGQIYSGRALEFDGVNDHLSVSSDVSNAVFGDYLKTFACWINFDDLTEQVIAAGWLSSQCIGLKDSQLATCAINSSDDTSTIATLRANQWYRIVVVSNVDVTDASAVTAAYADGFSHFDFYINGQLQAKEAANFYRGAGDMLLGARYYGSAFSVHFNGKMSDAQGWDTAWTADDALYDYLNPEQLALNRGGTSLTNSNLKIWYPMNDGHRGQQSYILDAANLGLGDNLLVNSDMELDSDWADYASPDTNERSSEQVYSGTYSRKLVGSSGKGITQTVSGLTAGGSYLMEAYIYPNGTSVDLQSDNGAVSHTVTPNEWNKVSMYINQPDTSGIFRVRSSNSTTTYIDNFNLYPVNGKNHATTVFYGDEIAVNGTFAADSDWTKGTGWTIGSGTADCDGSQSGNTALSQTYAGGFVEGRTYQVQFTISDYTAGNINPHITGSGSGNVNSNGTKTSTIVATSSNNDIVMYADSSFDAKIDDVSVKEIGTASGWTDADQQLDIPQTALQSYNQLLWCTASEEDNALVSIADNSNLDVDDKDFSLSCWIYPVTESDYLPIWRKGGAGSEGYVLTINNSNKISLNLNDGSSNNGYTNLTDEVVPSGKWSHVVVTCDRSSATGIKCYLNGELQSATDDPTGENEDIGNSSSVVMLGFSEDDNDSFSGTANELMLFKDSILTQAEVNELYNDGKALDGTTHSLFSTKCTAYYRNNGLSPWSNLATVADSGATSTAAASGTVTHGTETMLITAGVDGSRDSQGFLMNRQRVTNSLNLSDAGGYCDSPTGGFAGTSDFSIECWFKTSETGANKWLLSKGEGGSGGKRYQLYIDSSNHIQAEIDDDTALTTWAGSTNVCDGNWKHVVVTYDRNGNGQIYLNSATEGSATDISGSDGTSDPTAHRDFCIGIQSDTESQYQFNGQIDDVKFYTKKLEATEVTRNYNAGKRSHR